jgi:DNA mismatch repair protein MutS
VIERAKYVLARLEAEDRTSAARSLADDLPLFAAARRVGGGSSQSRHQAADAIIARLAALNPDEMTPREALEALYAIKLLAAAPS